jgi:antitoxin component of RelBE/YafQ-DinJ toxin-antitoxin module
LERVEDILSQLGLKPADVVNMLLAQIELQKRVPFEIALIPSDELRPSGDEILEQWEKAYGPY